MTYSNFFSFGIIHTNAIEAIRRSIPEDILDVNIFPLEGSFSAFYTASKFSDIFNSSEAIVLSSGILRDGTTLLSSASMAAKQRITPQAVDINRIHGNGLVACISKVQPRMCVYKTLFSAPQLYFTELPQGFVCSNNLGYMTLFMQARELNPSALPMHFLFRSVPGRQTYLSGVQRLFPGEILQYHAGQTKISLQRSISQLVEEESGAKLAPEESEYFFEQFCEVVDLHLKWTRERRSESAVLLSGGIDSTLLQLGVKLSAPDGMQLHSCSYASDAPSFAPEIENARRSASLLGSEHTFVRIEARDYPEYLISAIKTLGQPPHHEQMAYMIPLARHLVTSRNDIRCLLSGAAADTYHGMDISRDIFRANRYRKWPVWGLRLTSKVLERVWQSKSYGAKRAADLIPYLDDVTAIENVLNTQSVYTNWDTIRKCFSTTEINNALAVRRDLEDEYAASATLIEKVHILHLLTDMNDTAGLWDQIGLAYDEQILFPFMDEAVFRATLRYDPASRYFSQKRTKPILKNILERYHLDQVLDSPKYGGGFGVELPVWMRDGVLSDLVHSMDRPAFMEPALFEEKLEQPDWFTWNLLTMDLFKKHVLAP